MPLIKRPIITTTTDSPVSTVPVATTGATMVGEVDHKVLQPKSLDAKSRQIQRQGAFQAALQSHGLAIIASGTSLPEYLALVKEAAEAELIFINEL